MKGINQTEMLPDVTMHELSLVVPCYNEEETIENMAERSIGGLTNANIDFELILVDNGSFDNTAIVLDELANRYSQIKIVTVPKNEGYGWGVISGLRNCSGKFMGFVHADGQTTVEDVIKVYEKLKSDNLDVCKGKRTMRHDGLYRLFLSRSYNFLFHVFCSVDVEDVNGPPKLLRHDAYKKLNISSKDWFIDAEILIKAKSMGLRIGDVPVEFKKREKGKSKVKMTTIFEFLWDIIHYRLRGFE